MRVCGARSKNSEKRLFSFVVSVRLPS